VSTCSLDPFNLGLIRTSEVALEREVEGDLFLQDIGQGFGFRPGSFDGAIRCEPPPLPPLHIALTFAQHIRSAMAA
jgi:hypothetical protein